jgi:hypothetical protein
VSFLENNITRVLAIQLSSFWQLIKREHAGSTEKNVSIDFFASIF